jgi:hypothetical protein
MTTKLRMLLLACSGALSLVLAGGALAAFVPTISVGTQPPTAGSTGTISIRVVVPRDDDALFRAQIFAPPGYRGNLAAAVGTQVGTVAAQVQVREPIAGAVLPITGTILVADPATYVTQAAQCTGSATHATTWVLVLQAAGTELRVPVFVDPAPAELAPLASHVLNVCLPSPHLPVSSGGATFGAKLIDARLNTRGVFTAPATTGTYRWHLIATPWPNGPGLPNAAGTVNAQGVVGLPGTVSVRATSRRGVVTVTGRLVEGATPIAGRPVIVRFRNRNFTARTNVAGSFRLVRRAARGRSVTIRATANVPQRPSTTCSFQSPFPTVPTCVSETRGFFVVTRTIRHRVR